MDPREIMRAAFIDELEKIALSTKSLSVSKSRGGRRPISIEKLLKKDSDGSLLKKNAFQTGYDDGVYDTGASRPNKKRGEVPSRDDTAPSSREDGRENATNVSGPATLLTDVGAI